MFKKFTFILMILGLSATLASAYCSKEETLKLIDAGYSNMRSTRSAINGKKAPINSFGDTIYGLMAWILQL